VKSVSCFDIDGQNLLLSSDALKCNYCFGDDSSLCSTTSIQTCPWTMDACADVICRRPSVSRSFRSCMNMAACQGYIKTPGVFASCCSTDLFVSPEISL
uniref:UPAR/Ly6 domain-containing protein n=1 Tax=Labrus bergylta TaxID=56723 RepID=A0A3Q3FWQ0_9LABR